MSRPTRVQIDETALLHNLGRIREYAPKRKVIAMVKANAYGCGLATVIPVLDGQVDAFGVACLEEAMAIRAMGARTDCVLFQGVFSTEELQTASAHQFQCVVHQPQQLAWLLETPLVKKIRIWLKVNTGMHRLGFPPAEVYDALNALHACPWVDNNIGLMTHLACADKPLHSANQEQMKIWRDLILPSIPVTRSISNSAAIMALPDTHADVVRPGIMLYGVSPFENQTGQELGLMPVMRFVSAISAVHHFSAGASIGYGGTWQTKKPSVIGIIPVGYGDGYPRHISPETPVWINGVEVPIVGRVSMDMMAVDLTGHRQAIIGDPVELWGQHIPVETIAKSAGTIAYELLCQFSPRIRQDRFL
ncbi:alanine racemase [Legionella spiritensis]|uniref:alanine racemase n=1 Tax=Legionella spiritensis TaxID=452 RepID=UPI000F71CE21|nr:alanine racemase [Legionella spiritensis]VEG89642.1 alanine racemase [Legionella spiritensis]